MYTLQSARSASSRVKRKRFAARISSSDTSSVEFLTRLQRFNAARINVEAYDVAFLTKFDS